MMNGITVIDKQYDPCRMSKCKISTGSCVRDNLTSHFKCDLRKIVATLTDEQHSQVLQQRLNSVIEERRCPDALSITTLGEWRCDGLGLPALMIKECMEVINLQEIVENEHRNNTKSRPKIILILESPHKDEYELRCRDCKKRRCCGLYSSPAPARGETGRVIKRILPLLFDRRFDDYYVAFINVIQYQCSLGMDLYGERNCRDNRSLKNKIVWGLFDQVDYKACFLKRFKSAYNPEHDIVVVCTTGGKGKRDKIWKSIESEKVDLRCLLSVGHPCSWTRNRNACKLKINVCTNKAEGAIANAIFCESNAYELYYALSGKKNDLIAEKGMLSFSRG